MFLFASGGTAPSEALYVVAGGGNNARETFGAAAPIVIGGGNPSAIIAAAASAFASDVKTIVQALMGAGATKIVVWNVPDPGLSPAVLATGSLAGLATTIAGAMNAGLVATLGDSGLLDDVMLFDLFGLVHEVVGNPGAFGLSNVGDACAALQACIDKNAAGYLFWDGVHPTSVGHAILANEMIAFVPEPDSLALLAIAVLALGWVWARRKP
jgi:outer membrane lipase/esterase